MAQIDHLIGMMVQQHVERALLVNDKPMNLYIGGQSRPGSPISGAQLQTVLQEVTPPPMRAMLAQDGGFHFPYHSAHGEFEIAVARGGGVLQVTISPNNSSNGHENGHSNGHSEAVEAPPMAMPTEDDPFSSGGGRTTTAAAKGSKVIGHIDEIFRLMKEIDASDLHLSSDETPILRVQGKIVRLDEYKVHTAEMVKAALYPIAPNRNINEFE
ncbi:MAG TPA: hypothetical protein VF627_05630, partial [Abditibacterium sp.]